MTILKIDILGTGCKKCQTLEANTQEAITALNLTAQINHITDPVQIAMQGVMSTQALAVNGRVVSTGQVLSATQIQSLLQN